jgi:DNA-directed RNA polymerase subunit RPC12/RpoP
MAIEAAFACPTCGREAVVEDLAAAPGLACPCGFAAPLRPGALRDGRPARCPLCGDPRLYVQRDFSRKVGIGLLVVGFALAILLGMVLGPWGFFTALAVSVALDTALWAVAGNVVLCHWCETHLRGGPEDYPEFDLALHDVIRHEKQVAAQGQPVPAHEGKAAAAPAPLHPTEFDGKA